MATQTEDQKITVFIHPALNLEARVFGFPIAEFMLMFACSLIAANMNGYLFVPTVGGIIFLGKIRKKKPSNWLQFLPYLWFKIRYPYLFPPGRKTFLP